MPTPRGGGAVVTGQPEREAELARPLHVRRPAMDSGCLAPQDGTPPASSGTGDRQVRPGPLTPRQPVVTAWHGRSRRRG